MTKVVTPSGISAGQIGEIQEILGVGLCKSSLQSEAVQRVLETQGDLLVAEMVGVLRRRVEAVSDLIVRHVKVDRSRTPQQVIDATGRRKYTDIDVVETMPVGEGEEAEVHFFKLGRRVSNEQRAA